jgi:excisionase family DNA binding protein
MTSEAAALGKGFRANGRLTMTVHEAAQLLGVSEGVVRQSIRAKTIPSIRLGKRRVVIPAGKLYAILGEQLPHEDTVMESRERHAD